MYPYDTLRLGTVAYDKKGERIPNGVRPVYVQTKELLSDGRYAAVSVDGAIISKTNMRSNIERNMADSLRARMARSIAGPKF